MVDMISFQFQDFYVQFLMYWGTGLAIGGWAIFFYLWYKKDH